MIDAARALNARRRQRRIPRESIAEARRHRRRERRLRLLDHDAAAHSGAARGRLCRGILPRARAGRRRRRSSSSRGRTRACAADCSRACRIAGSIRCDGSPGGAAQCSRCMRSTKPSSASASSSGYPRLRDSRGGRRHCGRSRLARPALVCRQSRRDAGRSHVRAAIACTRARAMSQIGAPRDRGLSRTTRMSTAALRAHLEPGRDVPRHRREHRRLHGARRELVGPHGRVIAVEPIARNVELIERTCREQRIRARARDPRGGVRSRRHRSSFAPRARTSNAATPAAAGERLACRDCVRSTRASRRARRCAWRSRSARSRQDRRRRHGAARTARPSSARSNASVRSLISEFHPWAIERASGESPVDLLDWLSDDGTAQSRCCIATATRRGIHR